jgi:hypothetical protein
MATEPQGYLLTADNIQHIINAAVNAALHNAQPVAAPAVTIASTKDVRFADQKPFSGRTEDLDDFLNDCELLFAVKDDIYDTNVKQVTYALQLMKHGNAELWKKQYVQDVLAQYGTINDTWAQFAARLRDAFRDVGRKEDAMVIHCQTRLQDHRRV